MYNIDRHDTAHKTSRLKAPGIIMMMVEESPVSEETQRADLYQSRSTTELDFFFSYHQWSLTLAGQMPHLKSLWMKMHLPNLTEKRFTETAYITGVELSPWSDCQSFPVVHSNSASQRREMSFLMRHRESHYSFSCRTSEQVTDMLSVPQGYTLLSA